MKTLIFLHIPKTGGTTMVNILTDHYKPYEIFSVDTYNPKPSIDALRESITEYPLVRGHHVLGVHKYLKNESEYFCYVREPVDHFLSTFYYIKSRTHNRFHSLIKDMSLEEFLDSDIIDDIPDFDNYQTRMFTGTYFKKCSLIKDGDELEGVAIRNAGIIKNIFLTEDFNKGLEFLQENYNIPIPDEVRRDNNTSDRKRVEDVDPEVVRKIKERVEHDIALYEYCKNENDRK